ncbi:oligosaccharide flippase family protein [Enterococcus raffinosus]|uniref:putative polysaccharide biosynthesis protein n=1 Tax=Enterococcus raffinosus TaxID=71452 RepID=UPI001C44941C|nr:oligosaccharide flippase family protein [Enterococcus raffinosus]MDT2573256.1 oligosaccharide flippase family protein [Enterococcus raffinosus]QXJ61286.1 polysaccharide biosynthesis protein [Enterococcus raffinosus]
MTDNNTHENEFRETPSRMARYHTEAVAPPKKERKKKAVQVTEVEPTEPVAPQPKKQATAQEKMVQSTAWLTVGNIFSRLLGAVYVIPWIAWMQPHGLEANYLYTKGYNVYALFLMISTAGIPAAVAKQTARYNSMNEYGLSKKLLFYTMRLMTIGGIICAAIMFLGAPYLSQGNADLVPVMRSLSVVLLIFPAMSVIRGFFQGNNNMKPYAISQIVEQIARVCYMLASAFIIMQINNGSYKTAVVHSTFAAFIGVAFAMGVLLFSLLKERSAFRELIRESNNQITFSGRQLVLQMIQQAIPFIIVGSAISIFKLIDQYSFEKIMSIVTDNSAATNADLFALISANPDKLTMVVIALGTAMATAGLPLITERFTKKDHQGLAKLVTNNIQLLFFVMMPATVGMFVLAYPLNTLFYWPNQLGSDLLAASCVVGIMMGLFMVCSTMLQGLDGNMQAVWFLAIGIFVKIVAQFPLTFLFEAYGPLIATFVGFLVANMFLLDRIHVISQFPFRETVTSIIKVTVMSLIMGAVAFVVKFGCEQFLNADSKVQSMIIILIVAAFGGFTYMILALKTRMADKLLGPRVDGIRRRLHMR